MLFSCAEHQVPGGFSNPFQSRGFRISQRPLDFGLLRNSQTSGGIFPFVVVPLISESMKSWFGKLSWNCWASVSVGPIETTRKWPGKIVYLSMANCQIGLNAVVLRC